MSRKITLGMGSGTGGNQIVLGYAGFKGPNIREVLRLVSKINMKLEIESQWRKKKKC
jgi:hypothetical protein